METLAMISAPQPPPLSLRISVTDCCDLRCSYCMPAQGVRLAERSGILSYEEIVRFVQLVLTRYPISQVRITGGEPLVRPGLEALVAMLREARVPEIALTTNGQQLARHARTLREAGLDRVNISLDSLKPDVFSRITRGGSLDKTLDGIQAARRAGLRPIKLNTVVLRGLNDQEAPELVRFALEQECELRFLELMPIGEAAADFERRFVPSEETRARLREQFTLTALPFDRGGTSRNWLIRDRCGRNAVVGFISPYSEPFCSGCRRLRLTATGRLIGCLARPEGVPIAGLLRSGAPGARSELYELLRAALNAKRRDGEFIQYHRMVEIGG